MRSALLVLMLGGFALAVVAAASPELHKQLHHDSGEAQHQCLVTLLGSGGVDHLPTASFAVDLVAPPWSEPIDREGVVAHSFFLECSVFEHAPPPISLR